MRFVLFVVFSLFFSFYLRSQEPFRTWTSSDGQTLEARFIGYDGDDIRIRNVKGTEFELPLIRLSQEDRNYVKQAVARALFRVPEPFDGDTRGGVIIASAKGDVGVIVAPRYIGSQVAKPVARHAIVGEPLPHGSSIITGINSTANLLLTSGSLVKIGSNSKLVLSAFWQKTFRGSTQKVSDLKEETSSSRVLFKLEKGNLVIDVKKLNRDSTFLIQTMVGAAGIRGTQFSLSTDSNSSILRVLEGKVAFRDSKERETELETAQEIIGAKDETIEVKVMSDSEKEELNNSIMKSQNAVADYDLSRLSNTVIGFSPKQNYFVKSALNMEMIWCPPGSFIMGDKKNGPPRPVILTQGFYLGKYEVTQAQYKMVNSEAMRPSPSRYVGPNRPVEKVSWNDAVNFCKILNQKERAPNGWKFSLPTEAQWEYACRAGTTTAYSWGGRIDRSRANYNRNIDKTVNVGQYGPNPWGFFDMHGNVWEWVQDSKDNYPDSPWIDPLGKPSDLLRVFRGGSFVNGEAGSTMRYKYKSGNRDRILGFRLSLQKSQ